MELNSRERRKRKLLFTEGCDLVRSVSGSKRDLAMRVEGHSEHEDSPRQARGDRDDARYQCSLGPNSKF